MIEPEYIGHLLLQQGFKNFTLYLFKAIEGKKFIVEKPHNLIFDTFQAIYDGKIKRINFSLCPRSGKTTIAKWFTIWTLTNNPKSNIIYTSYNASLLSEISQDIANILEHPIYKAMFPNKTYQIDTIDSDPINDFWKDYLLKNEHKSRYSAKLIRTYAGGTVLFNAVGSAITGFGAGSRDNKTFSGFLLCFPYNEVVWTDKGQIRIGEIVENKLDVKVYSYNHYTNEIELQPIEAYIKNPGDDLVKITLENGQSFECTQNHKIWTENRGYVEAKDLISGKDIVKTLSYPFNLKKGKSCFFHNIFSTIIFISDKLQYIITQFYLFSGFIFNLTRKTLKRLSSFDIKNCCFSTIKSSSNFPIGSFILSYFNYIFTGKFTPRKNQSSKFNGILHIIGFSTISKVLKTIIRGVRIKMSNFHTRSLDPHKSPQNQSMNPYQKTFIVFSQIYNFVTICQCRIQDFFFFNKRTSIYSTPCVYDTRTTNHIPKVRNFINSLITRNILVNNVCFINHCRNSYCITVHNNHNFFVGKNQGVLVKNCDDINKPIDTRSEVLRKKVLTYYTDTLLSRINHSDTPIINIQQRLHLEDLTGYLQSKYNFETLKVPLLDENNVCNLPSQYTPERIKELKIDNYSFMCQYQQEPIVLGGAIIKREWFNYYDINFKYKYKKIVISADTAMSIKESADRTCLLVGGVTENNNLHILDFVCGRYEYPELKQKIVSLWNKWQLGPRETSATGLYIEEKASGIQAIQELSRCGIPIIPLKADKDKLARVQGVLEYMASGMVYLPQSEIYGFNNEILSELESFTRDNSHLHDDITDSLCYLINSTIAKQQVSILDVID